MAGIRVRQRIRYKWGVVMGALDMRALVSTGAALMVNGNGFFPGGGVWFHLDQRCLGEEWVWRS
jgi:hypothetical protein